ncbi:unannotated protein [freshwater metagenome]|uniref:Unannotated protein n=1 Tax=freshwater metagenome TaxID=449393 RepID=A0A6J7INB9_9ZZZZ
MSDDHVLVRTGGLVEPGPTVEGELFRDVDLNVIDEVAVPDRLEQPVGETERQDVLRRFLAEEVIDSIDLFFVEGLVQASVQVDCALQIGSERLLHDDARSLDQVCGGERIHYGQCSSRRNRQVVQPLGVASEFDLGLGYRGTQRRRPGFLRDIRQPRCELPPLFVADFTTGVRIDRFASEGAKFVGGHLLERGTHHANVRCQLGQRQVHHPGQQFPLGQISGRPEQDDDLGWKFGVDACRKSGHARKYWHRSGSSARRIMSSQRSDEITSGTHHHAFEFEPLRHLVQDVAQPGCDVAWIAVAFDVRRYDV